MALDSTKFVDQSEYYDKAQNTTDVNWTDTRAQEATARRLFAKVPALTAAIANGTKYITLMPATRKVAISSVNIACTAGGASAAGKIVAVDRDGAELGDVSGTLDLSAASTTVAESYQTATALFKELPVGTAHLALKVTGGTLPIGFAFTLSAHAVVQ